MANERKGSGSRFSKLRSGLAGLVLGASSVLGLAGNVMASQIKVYNLNSIVPDASAVSGEYAQTYDTSQLSYFGSPPEKKVVLLAYKYDSQGHQVFVGGLENDPTGPFKSNATGHMNQESSVFTAGLNSGDVLGSSSVPGGFLALYGGNTDANGDFYYGTYDPSSGLLIPATGTEYYPNVQFSEFSPFITGEGTIESISIPEPATMTLLGLGGLSMLGRGMFTKKGRKYIESEVADSK